MSVTGWRNALWGRTILIKQCFFFNYAYWGSASLKWKQSLIQTTLFYLPGLPGLRHTAIGMILCISPQLSRSKQADVYTVILCSPKVLHGATSRYDDEL